MDQVYQRFRPIFAPKALAARLLLLASVFQFLLHASLGQTNGTARRDDLRIVREEPLQLLDEREVGGRVYDLTFSPVAGSTACAIALDGSVQVWELTGRPKRVSSLTPPVPREFQVPGVEPSPHPIAFSRDGSRLAAAYYGVQIWDFEHRKLLFAVPLLWTPEAIRFTGLDSSLVVACSYDGLFTVKGDTPGMLQVFTRGMYEQRQVNGPRSFEIFKGPSLEGRSATHPTEWDDCFCLVVFPDGRRFAAGGNSQLPKHAGRRRREPSVKVWDIDSRRLVNAIGDAERLILRFCLSPDSQTFYSCGPRVLGWDTTKSAPPIKAFPTTGNNTVSIAAAPNGRLLGAGALDGTVTIWDVASAERLATLTHPGGPVYCLAFSPDSGKLVAAGERGIATVWDTKLMPNEQK
jgi:WD40 repeat protein